MAILKRYNLVYVIESDFYHNPVKNPSACKSDPVDSLQPDKSKLEIELRVFIKVLDVFG